MSIWSQLNNNMATIAQEVNQSLVQIRNQDGSIGSGTIWHRDGLIITNAHVIPEHHERQSLHIVLANGDSFPAQAMAYDQKNDLAALFIAARDLPTIMPGNSSTLTPGQWVMALGHPWGIVDAVTSGIIIGISSQLPEQANGRDWIALDLQLRPGHSGGPLIDKAGLLIGINTMIRGPEVGFAIPVNSVKTFLKQSIGKQQYPQPHRKAVIS